MDLYRLERIFFRYERDIIRPKGETVLHLSERSLCLLGGTLCWPDRLYVGLRGPFVDLRVLFFGLTWPCIGL